MDGPGEGLGWVGVWLVSWVVGWGVGGWLVCRVSPRSRVAGSCVWVEALVQTDDMSDTTLSSS